jgi:hypothetical protein
MLLGHGNAVLAVLVSNIEWLFGRATTGSLQKSLLGQFMFHCPPIIIETIRRTCHIPVTTIRNNKGQQPLVQLLHGLLRWCVALSKWWRVQGAAICILGGAKII